MEALSNIVGEINGFVWGPAMLVLILGIGFFLQVGLRFMPILKLGFGFSLLWKGREGSGDGQISPFNALMTSLSATIGTGNIAGVATAVFLGGPGALFWMWMTALVGMATKYAEAVCAVRFRERDELGNFVGGPMYYIQKRSWPAWYWLAPTFAVFGAIAGFGIGNTVQANSVASVISENFGIEPLYIGILIMLLTAAVILGGIQRIGAVAGKLVPFMAVTYIACGLIVLVLNAAEIPGAFALIFKHAFTPSLPKVALPGRRFGPRSGSASRGASSPNEAGLGSAPIAHAAAATKVRSIRAWCDAGHIYRHADRLFDHRTCHHHERRLDVG